VAGAASGSVAPAIKRRQQVTAYELQVAYDLYLARQVGMAGAVKPEYLPAAHRLTELGWLARRIEDDDLVFEFTNEGIAAIELAPLKEVLDALDPSRRQN
jgi:hypothetical protein